ncbi:ATP-binding protein [bacterium]|nr:ATP-binding protein [bacterium]
METTEIKPNLGIDQITVTIQGGSGTGKTNWAFMFGVAEGNHIGVVDADNKVLPAIHAFGERVQKAPNITVRSPQLSAQGALLPPNTSGRWKRFQAINDEFIANPKVTHIQWDTVTALQTMKKNDCIATNPASPKQSKTGGKEIMAQSDWGFMTDEFEAEMVKVITSGKTLIMLVHEAPVKDKEGNVLGLKPDLQGGLVNLIPKYSSEWWLAEVAAIGMNAKYTLRTTPKGNQAFKTALGLPSVFEFDYKVFQEKLTKLEESPWLKNVLMG